MTPQDTPVTFRQLPADEWEKLREVYRGQSDDLPPAGQNTAIVAEVDGQIIGMWGVNLVVHAGPLWVDPAWRGKGISDQMGTQVEELVRKLGASGYLMFPSNAGAEKVATRLGLEQPGWKVYRKEF
jgi:GNAT superfamily N-acetyltransferase